MKKNFRLMFKRRGNSLFLSFLLFQLSFYPSFAQNEFQFCGKCQGWEQQGDFGGIARYQAVAFSIDDKGYLGTGRNTAGNALNDFWEYDPQADTWTQKADYAGGARGEATAFVIDSEGYVGLGLSSGYLQSFWKYSPASNSWQRIADFPANGRIGSIGFSLGHKGYVGPGQFGTGLNAPDNQRDLWEYDPQTDTWTEKASFPGEGRREMAAFTIDNKAYAGLGGDLQNIYKDFWSYDPQLDEWKRIADFGGEALLSSVAFTLDGKGYVGTGADFDNFRQDFWSYHPQTDTWTEQASFCGDPVREAVAFVVQGEAYVATGLDSDGSSGRKDVWKYDPAQSIPSQGGWRQIADLTGIARQQAVSFTLEGQGYIGTGSTTSGQMLKDFWKFDPESDTWTQVADFAGDSRADAVSFVVDNQAYVGTGFNTFSGFLNDLWVYNATANEWSRKADLPASPRFAAFSFSLAGKGYIGTGQFGAGFSPSDNLSDFWEYDPATDQWTRKADFAGEARREMTYFTIGNRGYAGLGGFLDSNRDLHNFSDFWEYNPANDTWTRQADYPGTPASNASGFALGANGYVGLGLSEQNELLQEFWQYSTSENSWKRISDFCGGPSREASTFVIDNRAFLGTGLDADNQTARKDFWEFGITEEPNLRVSKLSLVDAYFDEILFDLEDGMTIDLDQLMTAEFSIQAFTAPEKVGSVQMVLTGPVPQTQIENLIPYTLFGDNSGKDIEGLPLQPGDYQITVTPYTEAGAQGVVGEALTLNFTVVGTPKFLVQSLVLVDADTDEDLLEIKDGDVIDLSNLSTGHLSIRALTSPEKVGSVELALNGELQQTQAENLIPYTLFGDNSGKDIEGRDFEIGNYQISAQAYQQPNLGGLAGPALTLNFELISSQAVQQASTGSSSAPLDVTAYPNPTQDQLSLEFDQELKGQVKVELVNASGQIIYQGTVAADEAFQLNLSQQTDGIYYLRLQDEQGNVYQKTIMKR